ncbi:MAG: glutamine--fructose-6-phosphate transaminase (isomerizing) [Candidatus Levyibacteriota bacterium]
MCGIFAYTGKRNNAASLVLSGLKALEYRGYDSWGVAAVNSGKLLLQKQVGKIGSSRLEKTLLDNSTLAIGHTRWATHGGVTVENAHPHLDCSKKLAIIHNGIVENYEELKAVLLKKKHVFLSETDTEVIAHLIEENLKRLHLPEAVRVSFQKLKGLSAIVVLDSVSRTIVAAKNGSPLILGIGSNELILASDLSAILPHTKKVVFLKDGEMVVLNQELALKSLTTGKNIKAKIEQIAFSRDEARLGSYKHFMMKEIAEQPKVIEQILYNKGQVDSLVQAIKKTRKLYFIAAGTAYHSTLAGVSLLSKIAGIQSVSSVASEFSQLEGFLDKKSLVIALSQSGETIDVIEPLTHAKDAGAKVAAITNVIGSTVYRMADYKILLNAGPEKAVASTKAYIAKLTVLLLTAYSFADREKEIIPQIKHAAEDMKTMLQEPYLKNVKALARKLKDRGNIYLIGRGISYASALEGALKIKEVSYIPTEGLAGGELKHGTIALIEKGTPCIVFAPEDEVYDSIISNAIEIKSRGGYIIGISSKKAAVFDYFLEVKDSGKATILSQIVPAQLLAYYLALARGISDPDKPRNLAKSVTVK